MAEVEKVSAEPATATNSSSPVRPSAPTTPAVAAEITGNIEIRGASSAETAPRPGARFGDSAVDEPYCAQRRRAGEYRYARQDSWYRADIVGSGYGFISRRSAWRRSIIAAPARSSVAGTSRKVAPPRKAEGRQDEQIAVRR